MDSVVSVISHSLVSYNLMCLQEQGLAPPFLPAWSILNSPSFYVSLSVWHTYPPFHQSPHLPKHQQGKNSLCPALVWVLHVLASSVIRGDNCGHPRGQTPALGTAQNLSSTCQLDVQEERILRLLALCQLPQTESSGIFTWFFPFRN